MVLYAGHALSKCYFESRHEYLNHDASQLPKQESRRKRMYVMSLLIYDIFEVPYGGWIDET